MSDHDAGRRPGFAAERRERILRLLRANGSMSLRELASAVHASEVTVRRDLRALAADGLLDRRHGGAMLPGGLTREAPYREKTGVATAEKAAIAEYAAGLVEDGDAIVLGGGTTTHELARRLTGRRDLTVVTNSLLVAEALADAPGAEVVMTGGALRGPIRALVGGAAERSLAGTHVRRAFVSGNGVSAARGLSTPNMAVAGVDRAMAEAAAEVIALADHTKVGADTMFQTVPPDRVSLLVTDAAAPPAELAALRAAGVRVHVVTP
ncbi:DeoR/GlpR family DNA-binding transcription regulator [Bailinhaonella thermotolerans]|uniref:DeoR/GlpR transcriptional regulator n=1 Tax=Bailinhaonella thermotolerans TaxID=1070861 RepID=A0A3A4A0Z9_9ACTN|nr:DeoR/GlpR family DNA-binding transcription regulator [Bailinhaonella thermotolerans]RJL21724.1 DeoR/GlpR transcriptional regulator [Bailinhaonella thermotolerans]